MNFVSKILSREEEPIKEVGPSDATHISAQKPITVTTTRKKKKKTQQRRHFPFLKM